MGPDTQLHSKCLCLCLWVLTLRQISRATEVVALTLFFALHCNRNAAASQDSGDSSRKTQWIQLQVSSNSNKGIACSRAVASRVYFVFYALLRCVVVPE